MRLYLPVGVVAGLAACSTGASNLPSPEVIDRIEQRLSANSCIGSMERWSRRYAYGLNTQTGEAKTDTIGFLFQEANRYEFREGRVVVTPEKFITIDDRPYRIATGTFSPATGKLELNSCGQNS